jgi:L-threonylcarbamoyladenylate synthase
VPTPAHPVAQAVLQACAALGVAGLAAPSANKFGRVSPTTAAHVQSEFGDSLRVLDGGPCAMGIESTIVDCTRGVPVLLRPGSIGRGQIEQACGQPLRDKDTLAGLQAAPRASGTLEAHYAPTAKVRLMGATALQAALDLLGQVPDGQPATLGPSIAVYHRTPLQSRGPQVLLRRMPGDAAATARQLFAALRDFDTQGVRLIWIETPPDTPDWEGVRDRLQRAAAA